MTKPLGVGVLSTAQKDGKLKDEHAHIAPNSMMLLNKIGEQISVMKGVSALTDVTGFGLLGHLLEICEGSGVNAVLEYDKVPVFKELAEYIALGCIPGGTNRNWDSYGEKVSLTDYAQRFVLADAQTSGGLLIAVDKDDAKQVEEILKANDLYAEPIGYLTDFNEGKRIMVK